MSVEGITADAGNGGSKAVLSALRTLQVLLFYGRACISNFSLIKHVPEVAT